MLIRAFQSVALTQVKELSSVLDWLVKVAQQVVNKTYPLVAVSLNLLVVGPFGDILTLLKVLQCLTEVTNILVFVGNWHVDSHEVRRNFLDKFI
jgi:hypothetical protein